MSFSYNPQDKIDNGGRAESGTYTFKVDEITEKTFKTGNDGWAVKLMVAAFDDRDVTVFDNIVNVPSALWKFEQFCQAFGFDFLNPPEGGYQPHQFEGRLGKAEFEKDDKGYLKVKEYQPTAANNGPDSRQATRKADYSYGPPPMEDEPPPPTDVDNLPF